MKHLLICIQFLFSSIFFLRYMLDFPFFIFVFDMEIALTSPELTLGQMKLELRNNRLREQIFHPEMSKNLSCTFPNSIDFA